MNRRMYGKYDSVTTDDGLRQCIFCGEFKPLSEFARNGPGAYRMDCKTCYNIRRRENRSKKVHSDFIGGQKRRGEINPGLTHQEWKECLIYFGGECAYCGGTPRKGQRLTKDHLLAVSEGGLTEPANIIPACSSCNSSKGPQDFKTWYMKQPFFSQARLNRIFQWRTIMRMLGGGNDDA